MKPRRREFVRLAMGAAALAVLPIKALAAFVRPQAGFDAKTIDSVFSALGSEAEDSDLIELQTPDIAENGAVVPVEVTSAIPGTSAIYIAIEMNPNPLAAAFAIPEGTEPYVATRVKVAQTCVIYAVVEANGKLYKSGRETKVTLGGCGG